MMCYLGTGCRSGYWFILNGFSVWLYLIPHMPTRLRVADRRPTPDNRTDTRHRNPQQRALPNAISRTCNAQPQLMMTVDPDFAPPDPPPQGEASVALSDKTLLTVSLAGFIVLATTVYILIIRSSLWAEALEGREGGGKGQGSESHEEESSHRSTRAWPAPSSPRGAGRRR